MLKLKLYCQECNQPLYARMLKTDQDYSSEMGLVQVEDKTSFYLSIEPCQTCLSKSYQNGKLYWLRKKDNDA